MNSLNISHINHSLYFDVHPSVTHNNLNAVRNTIGMAHVVPLKADCQLKCKAIIYAIHDSFSSSSFSETED